MPSLKEIRVIQMEQLFKLMKLKKVNTEAGINVKDLDNLIIEAETTMDKEDVAWVREKVSELK